MARGGGRRAPLLSRLYALDGAYHRLRAAIPSNSTRRKRAIVPHDDHGSNWTIALHDAHFQSDLAAAGGRRRLFRLQLRREAWKGMGEKKSEEEM